MSEALQQLGMPGLAELLEHHPAAYLIVSNGVCTYANIAAGTLFGRPVVGAALSDLMQPKLKGQVLPFEEADPALPTKFYARMGNRILRSLMYRVGDTLALSVVDATEEKRAQREALALAKMASGLTWGGSLDATMASLALNACEAVEALAAAVVLLDGDPPRARMAGSFNLPEEYLSAIAEKWREVVADNPVVTAALTGQIVVKQKVREAMLQSPAMEGCLAFLQTAPWDTVVIVPMIYRDIPLGTLNCYFSRCAGRDESEVQFLRVIADQAAVIVQNLRLIDEVRDKALLEERQRLARELHDSVSQALYGIALGARTARTLADRDPAAVKEPLDYVLSLAEAGLAEMRALIFELRPETIDSDGLVTALERQLGALQARHGVLVESQLSGEPELASEGRHALYRVAQEAIHNIVKHSGAAHVAVALQQEQGAVTLTIADDGRGFAVGDVPGHLGLRSMRERMEHIGGTLVVESQPGQGTRVRATAPPFGGDPAPSNVTQ